MLSNSNVKGHFFKHVMAFAVNTTVKFNSNAIVFTSKHFYKQTSKALFTFITIIKD